jgi:hypothetical protein
LRKLFDRTYNIIIPFFSTMLAAGKFEKMAEACRVSQS